MIRRSALVLLICVTAAAPARAQDTTLSAGAHYAKGALHRILFGSDWRDLWTAPIRVRVLDLAREAGGLTPTTAGGGFQTLSLRFRGNDGHLYGFRSVDKDPGVVPPGLDSTFIEDLIRDQTSSQHPGAPPVVAALADAAGILHTNPELVLLPDDPRLGEHRARFAGALGYFERRAVVQPGVPPFAGATELLDTDELRPRLRAGPTDRVHARAFLRARLFDILIGDWDRHQGQWTWALLPDSGRAAWVPLPEDRDQAFARFDGIALGIARATAAFQLTAFGRRFANTAGQTWNGRDLDREWLAPLPRAAWDSVAADLQRRLTDSVLSAAVHRMPEAWVARGGADLLAALRARRDRLPDEAGRFYRQLAREAEIHLTDAAERVTLALAPEGGLALRVAGRDGAVWLARDLARAETGELRLHLYGGADTVSITGGPLPISVRIIGGGNAVILTEGAPGRVTLYATGDDRVVGDGVRVEREPWVFVPERPEDLPPRDWGRRTIPASWAAFGPDVGLFAGTGFTTTRYAFRHVPYASQWRLRAGFATGARTFRAALDGTVYRESSSVHTTFSALASGIEVLHYHGLGNDTRRTRPNPYYRVEQKLFRLQAALVLPLNRRMVIAAGPTLALSTTEPEPGRIIADSLPYGGGDFGWTGLSAEVRWDGRDHPTAPRRGASLTIGGSAVPALLDAARAWGELRGEATVYLSATGAPAAPTLALRAGTRRLFGTFPYHAAAFIGDAATVRLGWKNRFGGDAAAWGSGELRGRLGRHRVLVPGEFGFVALADAGRVWMDGASPGGWHAAWGGGLWFSLAQPRNIFTLAWATSRERSALYLSAGFPY